MTKIYKIKRSDMLFVLALLFLAGFAIGATFAPKSTVPLTDNRPVVSVADEHVIEMGIPAIDEEGSGVIGKLTTTVRPGSGQVLVNVNSVLAQFDTQLSGRIAAQAASDYTGMSLENVDVIYDMEIDASVIEGPSAGAAMASSIVLALQNTTAPQNIMMTGTIREDGSIGPVGAVLEKATAAKEEGATIFLVPDGLSSELKADRVRSCRDVGSTQVCRITYEYDRVNIGESLGITVTEVSTLGDIIEVFSGQASTSNQGI